MDARRSRIGGPRVISERSRVVAIQAIVVGVLMAVVFLTLLQPEDENPLYGINGPGSAAPNPEYIPARPGGADGGIDRGTGGDQAGGGALGPTVAATDGDYRTGPSAGPTLAGSQAVPSSPTEDQYADTLARLSAKLK